jgi:hypothetical protein
MNQEERDDRYRPPLGELIPIAVAAMFGLAFLAGGVWLLFGSAPFLGFFSHPQAAEQPSPGEVTVAIPEKKNN